VAGGIEQKAEAAKENAKPVEPDAAKVLPVSVDPKTFKLGAEDVIAVSVWREPDLSRVIVIRPDGKITMPLAGELQAEGKTPEQLGGEIAEALKKSIVRPEVTVSVQSVRSRKYYISGEILKPGAFPLAVPTTVLEALTQAGGFRDFANKKKIVIMRGGERIKFNYNEVIKGKNLSQNILLENGDHIVVP
jgi:polysaccharide export outer membrane protein